MKVTRSSLIKLPFSKRVLSYVWFKKREKKYYRNYFQFILQEPNQDHHLLHVFYLFIYWQNGPNFPLTTQ